MVSIANRKQSHGAGSASVYLNVVLIIIAAVGWYLFFEEQRQHLATAELLSISEEAAAQLAPTQDQVEELDQEIDELMSRLGASQDELANTAADLERARTKLVARDEVMARLEQARTDIEQELDKERLLHEQSRITGTRLEQARADIEQELAKERLLHEQSRAEQARARESLQQLQASLADGADGAQSGDAAQARIARLEADLAAAHQRAQMTVTELEQELQRRLALQSSMESRASEIEAERGRLAEDLAREQAQREELLGRIASISSDVEAREAALSGAQQNVRQLSETLQMTRQQQDELRGQLEQQQAEARHFAELKNQLEQQLNETRIQITQLKNRMTVINLTSEVLFESGSARIKPAGQKVLALIADSLNNYPDRAISVEGHTDNVPIGRHSPYSSNWELSAARAMSAVSALQRQSQVDPARLRVVGHGEHKPVASNDSGEGRQANRRIEIRLLPAPGQG